MINLLPPDTKREIRAARTNVLLTKIVTLLSLCIVAVVGTFGYAFYATDQQRNAFADKQAVSQQSQDIQKQASDFAKNLKDAKTIIGGQISYTTLLIKLTNALPKNTSITSINLTNQSFGSQITLSALAGSTNDALNLRNSLRDSGLLTDLSFQNITNTTTAGPYGVTATIVGTLTKTPPIIAEEGEK